jgi:phospholipid/cholesterol/gamma-HCH transport system substrate-binding protein
MKINKTAKIGLLTLGSLAILIWGVNFLKGRDIFKSETIFYAQYRNVGGLEASSDVRLNGFKVGYVRDIYFKEDHSGNLMVKLAINKHFEIPKGTVAEIVSTDILGSRSVQLTLGKSNEYYQSYDTLRTSVEADLKQQVSDELAPIKAKAENLLASLDSAITVVTYVFNERTRENLRESFAHTNNTILNLEQTSKNLNMLVAEQKENISAIIANIRKISETLNNNADNIDNIMKNLSNVSDTLSALQLQASLNRFNDMLTNLDSIMAKVNNREGSLGLLVNDPLLYNNLNRISQNLNRLLIDLRQNPKRFIHFSAFDLGKEIYLTPKHTSQPNEDVKFRVLLMSSTSAIPLESSLFKPFKDVEEVKSGKYFTYFTGNNSSIEKIRSILNKAQNVFPDASIVAFKNGKKIRLEKALKKVNK